MIVPDEERERVRSYLIAQAGKLPLRDLVEKVRADTAPLRDAARAIPAERFAQPPADGEWSAAQVWDHILAMNEQGASAIASIIASGAVPGLVEDVIDGSVDARFTDGEACYRAYAERRSAFLDGVLEAKGDEHLDVKLRHPVFGDLNWREWLLFMRVHDLDHLRQLQAIAERLDR
jgi:uncharacterized damage-inducible protein DinB